MKYFFTFIILSVVFTNAVGQLCTVSPVIENCPPGSPATFTSFANPVLFSGPALKTGAKYKYNNVAFVAGPPSQVLDAIVTIEDMVNATMLPVAAGSNACIDDDAALNQDNSSQASFFSPRITSDQPLNCADRRGYVQFSIIFYPHFTGNTLPASFGVIGLNIIQYDMDGHVAGANGWLREIGYIKKINLSNPVNNAAALTELNNGGTVADAGSNWLLTFGSSNERNAVSNCSEVAMSSYYSFPQTAVTFRLGYDYKAPVPCNAANEGQPTRDYAVKPGCFTIPNGGPLPVSISTIGVNYKDGIATLGWTTFQEFNLISYEVQRSTDGINYESVGTVPARNVLTKEQYKFTDNVAAINTKYLYYRLRIVDRDNTFKVSNVVSIKMSGWKSNEMIVTPNPSAGNAQIIFKANKGGVANINVTDASGKIVLKQQAQILSGNNNIAVVNMSSLTEGYYIVSLFLNDETFVTKLLVKK